MVVVVQSAKPLPANLSGQLAAQRVKKGDILHAVVTRTKQKSRRLDGSIISFGDNACVLLQKSGEPVGTRVTGVIAKEVKEKGFAKIAALAPRIV